MEYSVVLIKPDAVARGLVGEITTRFEKKGLLLCDMSMTHATTEQIARHYHDLVNKPHYPSICQSMTCGPLVAQLWMGLNSVSVIRSMLGATDPQRALPGTIRGDLSMHIGRNVCHASDSHDATNREIGVWFPLTILRHSDPFNLSHIYRINDQGEIK